MFHQRVQHFLKVSSYTHNIEATLGKSAFSAIIIVMYSVISLFFKYETILHVINMRSQRAIQLRLSADKITTITVKNHLT